MPQPPLDTHVEATSTTSFPNFDWQIEFESCLSERLLVAIYSCSATDTLGQVFHPPSGADRGWQHRWLHESLRVLEERGYLESGARTLTPRGRSVVETPETQLRWAQYQDKWSDNPEARTQATLASATLESLSDILNARRSATDILFSSLEDVQAIFLNGSAHRHCNNALAEILLTHLKERWQASPSLRPMILEIGAGIGGTTDAVLAALSPFGSRIGAYYYTDISRVLLIHGRKTYGAHPYVAFRSLDLNSSSIDASVGPGTCDVVIAANALHAAKSIRTAIRHAKRALIPGGLLLLSEIARKSLFTHCTWGLLEAWWGHEDHELRIPGCPGLEPATWQRLLAEEGFRPRLVAEQLPPNGLQLVVALSTD